MLLPSLWRLSQHNHSSQLLLQKVIQTLGSSPVLLFSTKTSSNYNDYLHESLIPTHHFQKSLPRLPIPKLEKTCERYMNSLQPLLEPADFKATENIVNNFRDGEGSVLHEELVAQDKENKHTSYISEPWFNMYLCDRRPVVLNHNPFMSFNPDPRPEYNDQLVRATNMVVSSLRYLKTYRAGLLEPEVFHLNPAKSDNQTFRKRMRLLPSMVSWYGAYLHNAYPLDMSQYDRLFNSSRIPRPDKDELVSDPSAKHLLVMRNGNFYIFDVFDRDGNILAPDVIQSHLSHILSAPSTPPEYPIGVLTTENRDKWASVRQQLLNAGNEIPLQMIDSSLFVLIFEDSTPQEPNDVTRLFLHGNGANRWFDKSFSLIMNKDGRACVNFEHSWGDGVAVLRYFNEIFKDGTSNPYVHPGGPITQADSANLVQKLEFKLDPLLQSCITEAQQKFIETTNNLDLHHLEFTHFTKKFLKEQKISPDSVLQLAIQMAFYKQTGQFAATYESCSTAAFKHGRTETVRSCTIETKRACEMLSAPGSHSVGEMNEALTKCSSTHSELIRNAAMGQGFDRHLFSLKNLAQAKGGNLPKIFADPVYSRNNHIILSTSTLTSPAVEIGGFAPVVPDGYGIGYSVEDNRIGFNVTSYKGGERNVRDFLECAESSLKDIKEVLEGRQPTGKS